MSSSMKYPLTGLRVLITRPAAQAAPLFHVLKEARAIPFLLPIIGIHSRLDDANLIAALNAYDNADYLIFTSVNAVIHAVTAIKAAKKSWPPSKTIFAIGSATRDHLYSEGCTQVIIPADTFCSENLLNEMASYPICDKLIIIFGGANPKKLLESTLKDWGAQVLHAICYERRPEKIKMNLSEQNNLLDNSDVFLCTSNEILANFLQIFDKELHCRLFKKPFLVVSHEMVQSLKKMGYTKSPIIADNPTDSGIMTALTHWYE